MSTHKHIDIICLVVCLAVLAGVSGLLLWRYPAEGRQEPTEMAYETGLFDTERVHTLDIQMEDWEGFLETCEKEEYAMCSVVIDGEAVSEVGIRAKGNTSLSSVKDYGNERYSFKLEFDQYRDGGNYRGLDKLSLNNLIQDNTMMKDYLTYQLMGAFGVKAPLCSYVNVTVNGEPWGLYLAVEAVEESFQQRSYGGAQGELYKPDAMSMGGGKGFGGGFEMPEEFMEQKEDSDSRQMPHRDQMENFAPGRRPDMDQPPQPGQMPEGMAPPEGGGLGGEEGGPGGFSMGSDDVKLIYTDDEFDSYSNIFDNAKTDITDRDKSRLIASLKTLNEGETVETVVDVEAVIRYFVVHNFVCNFDSYTGSMIHNYYLYEEDGVLSMIPWDYNLAFGGFMGMESATELVNYDIDQPVSGVSYEDRPMLSWILDDERYKAQYHSCFAEFLDSYYHSGWLSAEIERVSALIAPYVEQDPTKFCTNEEFEAGVAALKEFCLLRCESIRNQLANVEQQVDASHLDLSDMGSMGTMGGPGGGVGPAMGERPQPGEWPNIGQIPERPESSLETAPS